ncbi:MAG: hypothetical protein AB7F99_07830 [Vicinamibacterales bacterium]
MRTLILKTGLLGAALVALAAAPATASTVEVSVPFPFVVEGGTLPAGQYLVTNKAGVVELRGEHGNDAVRNFFVMPASGRDPAGDRPTLTFKRDGSQYRLTDVWEWSTYGLEPIGG